MKEIYSYITTRLNELNFIHSVKGLCKMVIEEDKQFPAYYIGNDELRQVTNSDFNAGVAFFLPNGEYSISDGEQLIAGKTFSRISIPVSFYCIIRNGTKGADDANYSGDLAIDFLKSISFKNPAVLRAYLQVSKCYTELESIETKAISVLDELFVNVDKPDSHDVAAIRINMRIVAEGNIDCINLLTC